MAVDLEKGEQIPDSFNQALFAKSGDLGYSMLGQWSFCLEMFCSLDCCNFNSPSSSSTSLDILGQNSLQLLIFFSNPLNIDVPQDSVLGSVLFHSHSLPE